MDGGHEKLIHVAAVQTCGSSEHVRLALCSAVRLFRAVFTCLRVSEVRCCSSCVCAARSLCAPPFLRTGECRVHAH